MPVPTGSSSNAGIGTVSPMGSVMTGPVIGAQQLITFSFVPVASQTDLIVAAFRAPCDMRLEKIGFASPTSLGAASDTFKFLKHATAFQTSGAVSLTTTAAGTGITGLTGALDDELTPLNTDASRVETLATCGASLSTVAGVRDIAKGTRVFLAYTTDATAVTAGTVVTITYTVVINGFSNVNGFNN